MPTSLQVLMLEDNPSDAELYLLELRRAGFDPEWKRVETEEEFLAALHPALDIILSDYSLPQFDGLSALRLLRARSLVLPFILISGMIGEDIAISAMKEGADDYLLKDRLARLGPAVKNALEQKRLRDERKQAEEQNRLLASLVANVSDAIISTDMQLNIQSWNAGAETMYGWKPEEVIGKPSKGVLESQFIGTTRQAVIKDVMEKGYWKGEVVQKHRDGTNIFALSSITQYKDAGGRPEGIVTVNRDISERKRAEQQMLTLVESMADGVLVVNAEGQIEVANAQSKALFGYQKEELLGQSIETLLPERVRNIHPGHRAGYFASPRMRTMGSGLELYARRKDGTEFPVDISLSPMETGHGTATVAIIRDITERKRAEEERLAREFAERANQAKSEFLSRMSHELRTPMNSILGFAQLLKMDELAPDQLSSLEQILKSGSHLLDLINEVLDIARIESGRLPISPEPVQLSEALQSATDLIRPMANKRGISIEIKIPSLPDVFVTADKQRLKQVMLNLLSNAVKYNREGGQIQVTASLLVDGFMHLAVRDTGKGIPPEKMERLFVPFERLELDPTLMEGTGLGLALSKGLVEAMGGRIGAQSVVGEGSTFWFDLELTSQQKDAIVMAEVDDYLEAAPGAKKGLVLYVEDNLSNIQLIEKILARLPYVELISAMQGRLALNLARQHKPRLILLDLHLPDMHGSDVLQQLRAEVETKDIPTVVMSADATHGQIERTLTAGANAYLTKPIDVKEFLKVVGEMLER